MKNQKLLKGYALVMLSALLFGCMPLITTYIYREGISRESVVLMRNMLALPLLGLLSWRQSKSMGIPLKALPAIGAIALMGCCVTPLLLYSSYQHIATGTATVFHFIYPAVCRKILNRHIHTIRERSPQQRIGTWQISGCRI